MEITRTELNKWEALIAFYTKQLEDRAGIIERSKDLDDDPEWLVKKIEDNLTQAQMNFYSVQYALASI